MLKYPLGAIFFIKEVCELVEFVRFGVGFVEEGFFFAEKLSEASAVEFRHGVYRYTSRHVHT